MWATTVFSLLFTVSIVLQDLISSESGDQVALHSLSYLLADFREVTQHR